ncbi:hypothetical protein BC830DRAFT_709187 [Chytriomyces sp. MP71]|nr:hypothetical protein BC830DRAFT_709187 [Chytriomyces sp. MP71]
MSSMDYGNEDEHTGETAETGAWREGAERDTAQFVRPERERGSGTGALSGGEEYGHLGEAAAAWGSECRRATAAGVEAEACDDQHQLTGIRNSQSQSVIPKAPVSLSMSTQTLTVQAESEVAARLGLDTDSSVGQEGDHDPFIAKDLIASNPNPSLQKLQPVDQQLSTTQEMQDRDPSGAELGVMVLSLKHLQASEQPPFGSEKTPLQDSDAKQDPPTDNAERLRCHLPAMSAAAEFFNEPLGPVTPEEDPVNLAAPCETFYGFIKDAHDALLVIEGVVRGILKPFNGRTGGLGPAAGEAGTSGTNSAWDMQIRSGTVIVFAEISSQMKRWRDGERWSPSRAHGPFLLYRYV